MALLTGGTTATTSLNALVFNPGDSAPRTLGAFNALVLDDQNPKHPIAPTAFIYSGKLFIPNRGVLNLIKGDVIMNDTVSGWPILVSGYAFTVGSSVWHHS